MRGRMTMLGGGANGMKMEGRRTLFPGVFEGENFEVCKRFALGMVSPFANSNSFTMIGEERDFFRNPLCQSHPTLVDIFSLQGRLTRPLTSSSLKVFSQKTFYSRLWSKTNRLRKRLKWKMRSLSLFAPG